MKTYVRQSLLIIILAISCLLLLLRIDLNANKKPAPPKTQVANKISYGLPVRLIIPAINIDTNIQSVGVSTAGEMEAPSNAVDVGWLKLDSRPGEKGSAVIDGHLNDMNGDVGVFANLNKLRKGDKLYIQDNKGKSITFVVRESRIYNAGYAEEVFSSSGSAHLNLITCDGLWDDVKKNYTKRLVVFTDIFPQP